MSTANTTFYLVRHGQTEWNRNGRQQGQLDSPLTHKGEQQAHAAGRLLVRMLRDEAPFVVETSPLGRARQTAAIVCMGLDVGEPATVEPLLAEHHLGVWQGLTLAEVDDRFPGTREARANDEWNYRIPGGESYSLMSVRARRWLALDRGVPIRIAVTHELMSQTIQGAYGHLSPSETLAKSHPQTSAFRMSRGRIEELHLV